MDHFKTAGRSYNTIPESVKTTTPAPNSGYAPLNYIPFANFPLNIDAKGD